MHTLLTIGSLVEAITMMAMVVAIQSGEDTTPIRPTVTMAWGVDQHCMSSKILCEQNFITRKE